MATLPARPRRCTCRSRRCRCKSASWKSGSARSCWTVPAAWCASPTPAPPMSSMRGARGALRLATTPTFTAYLTGPLLAAYHARHPGIALHLREMPLDLIEAALADDEVDLAIAFSEVRSAELECQPLFAEQLSVVVGQDHPCAKRRKPLTPAELARQPLALLSADFATRGYVDAYFRRQDIVPRIAIEAN